MEAPPSSARIPAEGGGANAAAAVTGVDAESLYLQNCASCHGPQGRGTASGPTLVGAGAASADFYLRTGRMPVGSPDGPVVRHDPVFSDAQIRALVAYVAGFGEGPDIPQVSAGGDLNEGWRLYTANCAACHQADGGGATGVAASLAGSAYVNGTPLRLVRILLQGKEGTMLMPPVGATMTDEQLAAILSYIRREWGNAADPIDAEFVKEIRGVTTGRTKAWTDEELAKVNR